SRSAFSSSARLHGVFFCPLSPSLNVFWCLSALPVGFPLSVFLLFFVVSGSILFSLELAALLVTDFCVPKHKGQGVACSDISLIPRYTRITRLSCRHRCSCREGGDPVRYGLR